LNCRKRRKERGGYVRRDGKTGKKNEIEVKVREREKVNERGLSERQK
jgi:hypothetical protein